MTLEELQQKVSDLEAEKNLVDSKNKELVVELRKVKSLNKEVDVEKHFKLVEDFENLASEHDKLLKTSKIESEKMATSLKAKDDALRNHLIEEGLTSNLAKAGVKPKFLEASKALLRTKALLKEENGAYQALLGDKPLTDGIAEWVSGEGKHFIQASGGSGGGASGGGSHSGNENYKRSEMNHSQKGEYIAKNGQEAYFKLPN